FSFRRARIWGSRRRRWRAGKAVAIRKSLAEREPRNVPLKRKLAISYLRISALQRSQNESAAADQGFGRASDLLKQVSREAVDSAAGRLDLARLYREQSRRQYLAGNFPAARSLIVETADLHRRVLADNPGNRDARRQFADIQIMMLATMGAAGYRIDLRDRREALEIYREADRTLAALSEETLADPGSRALMMTLYTRGCGLTNLLDPGAQMEACRRSAALADDLAAADPANVPARLAAINAHHNL